MRMLRCTSGKTEEYGIGNKHAQEKVDESSHKTS